eukprot:TRINITY_DN15072_c0_g1_i1.p1 TRINITY_DN15072_c0_g1~~TRINITY_DN15072_c0_g1_i1.p1  ORF type:complete len:209 (-),score=50.96 TRINITY_DN15072_c0_g1_i1:37-663(-)
MSVEDNSEDEKHVSLILRGDQSVGKTSIMLKFCEGEFSDNPISKIETNFKKKQLNIKGKNVELLVTDVGPISHENEKTSTYQDAQGIILVYDVTRPETFERLDYYLKEAERYMTQDSSKILILGTKLDLGVNVDINKVNDYVDERELSHYHVSSKNGDNLEKAFINIVGCILNEDSSFNNTNKTTKPQIDPKPIIPDEKKKKKACCII